MLMIYHEISEAYMKDNRFEFGPEGQFNITEWHLVTIKIIPISRWLFSKLWYSSGMNEFALGVTIVKNVSSLDAAKIKLDEMGIVFNEVKLHVLDKPEDIDFLMRHALVTVK